MDFCVFLAHRSEARIFPPASPSPVSPSLRRNFVEPGFGADPCSVCEVSFRRLFAGKFQFVFGQADRLSWEERISMGVGRFEGFQGPERGRTLPGESGV